MCDLRLAELPEAPDAGFPALDADFRAASPIDQDGASTCTYLTCETTCQTVSSFASDWILWDKNELEIASAIYNSPCSVISNDSSETRSVKLLRFKCPECGKILSKHNDQDHLCGMQETDEYEFASSPMDRSAKLLRFKCPKCGKILSKHNDQDHLCNMRRSNRSSSYMVNWPTSIQGMTDQISLLLEKKKWDCPHPTCKYKGEWGFSLRDNLIQHCRYVHNKYYWTEC